MDNNEFVLDNTYCYNKFAYNKIVRLTFFSVGIISVGGFTFYYVKNRYGDSIKNTLSYGVWELFKLETVAKMSFAKLYHTVNDCVMYPIKSFFKGSIDDRDVYFYMNGRLIKRITYLESLTYQPSEEYNLIIYKIKKNNEEYYKLFENHQDINDELEESSVRFLSLELSIDGVENKIPFKFNDLNVYVKGNKLFTRGFIEWFVMEKHGIRLNEETNYSVYTIDNQINIDQFDTNHYSYQYAVITHNSYDKEIISVNVPLSNTDDSCNTLNSIICNKEEGDSHIVENVEDIEDSSGLLTNVIYSWFGYKKNECV